jgi:peroxiredoxin Q/BCP
MPSAVREFARDLALMPTLTVGRKAPDFALETDSGTTFRLSEAGTPVVLFFYPEDDTEGCTIQNLEFSKLASEFAALGVKLLGISPDSVEKHCKFRDKYGLIAPLAADTEQKVTKAYGAWGPKKLFGHEYDGVIRSSFLIDAQGKVAGIWKVTRIKGHAQLALDAARALVAAGGKVPRTRPARKTPAKSRA